MPYRNNNTKHVRIKRRRGYKAAERRSSLQSKHRGWRMKTISRIIHATTVACNQRMPFLLSGRMNESAANSDPWHPPRVGWRKLSRTIPLQLLSSDWGYLIQLHSTDTNRNQRNFSITKVNSPNHKRWSNDIIVNKTDGEFSTVWETSRICDFKCLVR